MHIISFHNKLSGIVADVYMVGSLRNSMGWYVITYGEEAVLIYAIRYA